MDELVNIIIGDVNKVYEKFKNGSATDDEFEYLFNIYNLYNKINLRRNK